MLLEISHWTYSWLPLKPGSGCMQAARLPGAQQSPRSFLQVLHSLSPEPQISAQAPWLPAASPHIQGESCAIPAWLRGAVSVKGRLSTRDNTRGAAGGRTVMLPYGLQL